MTDEVKIPTDQSETPEEKRDFIHKTVSDIYATLMLVVKKLPAHPGMMDKALGFFDTGLLWTRQIIDCMEFIEEETKKQEEDGA